MTGAGHAGTKRLVPAITLAKNKGAFMKLNLMTILVVSLTWTLTGHANELQTANSARAEVRRIEPIAALNLLRQSPRYQEALNEADVNHSIPIEAGYATETKMGENEFRISIAYFYSGINEVYGLIEGSFSLSDGEIVSRGPVRFRQLQ
jgi:hypothetical protein